ncbi:hypothetical protein ABMA27_003057 [Loxostege sticticalis]|uniref:THAP-type domain-containing protein n=1 Tax=Loxostege sticticalis TaxID=481309 RepID=A0ABR3HRU1_LOXSC
MPRCCVPNYVETGGHQFPRDVKLKKLWLKAIRRLKFEPKSGARVCHKHFKESDYEKIGKYSGIENQRKILKKSAIPSIFSWNVKPTSSETPREQRIKARNYRNSLFPGNDSTQSFSDIQPLDDANVSHHVDILENQPSTSEILDQNNCTKGTQTSNILRLFSTDLLLNDNETVNYYTGLESYSKFTLVLSTLMPMANDLKYRWTRVVGLSLEDQFLMLLIKLRRNKPDFEIGKIFGVSRTVVSNVIITWINFVNDIWSLLDIWPSRELVDFYMPENFKSYYPSTRVIIDGTEIPIQKPSQPDAQKVSFSQYKHRNTLKFLVGSSPGGLLTFCSEGYAGSVSDRQIVERSNLLQICDTGDSIMADRGFNVQDLFANKGIGINIPNFLKGKSQIPGVLIKQDQRLSSQRVHNERLIGLTKTYKILTSELNQYYAPMASKIFLVCLMLCNFREGIVHK